MTLASTHLADTATQVRKRSGVRKQRMEKAFWVVSLLILLSDSLFVLVNHLSAQQVFEEHLLSKGQENETLFNLNLRDQGLHMQQFATYLANQPEVRDLFIRGAAAVAAEGGGAGGERAAQLRQALFDTVAPGWQKVTGQYQVRQLHFHLGPGDVSFLRVHKPGKFGDDLSTIRHTIVHAIRDNKTTHGFESGRVYAGIRGVVPITADHPGGEQVIGALEAGSSFSQMLEVLKQDTGVSHSVLLSDAYFHRTHWPAFAARLKRDNPLVDGWYIEGGQDRNRVKDMLQDPQVKQALGQRRPVIAWIANQPYSVYSYPFRDFLRKEQPQLAPIGMILSWHDASAELAAVNNSLRNNLLLGVIGFLIIETLLYTAWNLARNRLQRVIEDQTSELAEVNYELQREVGLRMQSELQLQRQADRLEDDVRQRTASLRETVGALELEIGQRETAESQLQQERDRARATLHSIADGVISTDADGRVQYLNPTAEKLTGWSLAEAREQHVSLVFPARDIDRGDQPLGYADWLDGNNSHHHGENTELKRRNGDLVVVEHTISPIFDSDGNPNGLVLVFHDDTEARELATQLSYQASHDALTGLLNRRAIEQELSKALQHARSHNKQHAFLYLDLDQFKVVNDTCGHVAGDELLRQVGSLLRHTARQSDQLARLGGDEFGLLLRQCPIERACEIAENLLAELSGFRFVWEERSFRVGGSIGGALVARWSDSVESILGTADSACYIAKEKGRGCVHFVRPGDNEVAQRTGEMNWVSRIQHAISEDRLVLFGQPIVPISDQALRASHNEILVRMLSEDGGLIAPNAFIPAAERYGIMHEVDRSIIERTFQLIDRLDKAWEQAQDEHYSINLSGESMAKPGTLEFIDQHLQKYQVDPKRICFEVTETAAISNLGSAIDLMGALKNRGCRFALDDFGSGLSSFGYLKALPVDYLKIDGVFVRNLDSEPVDQAMVKAINAVGHAMQLETIAEFVETDGILQLLRDIGVDYAQGYWVGKPRNLYDH